MRKISLLLILCFIGLISKEQTIGSQNLLLHTSKTICNPGDNLPFKCYIINSINHIGEDKNLYIILIDKAGNIVFKDRYPVFNASANGNIAIPKELPTGRYTIGSFTPYMLNNKIIKYNTLFVEKSEHSNDNISMQLKVFTNNLISNVSNTFFIKTEIQEIPKSCKVTLVDKEDKELKQFVTDANGIAIVNFMPSRSQEYSLVVNSKKYLLPRPDSIGINIQTSFEKNILNFLVNKNFKLSTVEDYYTITAYQKDVEVYKTNFSFDNYSSISAGVNVDALPSGIVKIIVHNKDKVPVCSTFVYLKNSKNFDLPQIKTLQNKASNKLQVELGFQQPAIKFISAAINKIENSDSAVCTSFDFFYIRDQQQFPSDDIIAYYEIGSPIQTQHYIVLTPTIRTLKEAVVLPKIADDYGIVIRGKVYDPTGQNVLGNGFLNFTSETKDTIYYYSTKVKGDGSFTLDSLFFVGTQKFEYSYLNSNKKEVVAKVKIIQNNNDFLLDSILLNSFKYVLKPKENVVASIIDTISTFTKPVNTEQTTKENKNEYATGIYATNSSATIDNIKNPPKDGNMSGTTFVKNRIQNTGFQGGNFVNTKNLSLSSGSYWPIGIVIDEIPVTVADLNLLTANDIGVVKFFEPGHIAVGTATPGGVIAIYTKNKVLQANNGTNVTNKAPANTNLQIFEYTGFSEQMNNVLKKTSYQHLHNMVYWNPSIILNKDQTTFSFEVEGLETLKIYKLVVLGYNELGQLINIEKNIAY